MKRRANFQIYLLLALVLAVGAWLRLTGVNWDSGFHLHPDERHISMVANDTRWPKSWKQYFDVADSPLSPYNYPQYKNYLYGTLPLFATKALADLLGQGDYGHLNWVGRKLSAVLDTLSILLVFLIARRVLHKDQIDPSGLKARWAGESAALLAAAFYAFTVTAIQHAHFFTMESWLVFFTLLTFYWAAFLTKSTNHKGIIGWRSCMLAGLTGASLGLTLASKISGVFVIIPVGIALLGKLAREVGGVGVIRAGGKLVLLGAIVLFAAYLSFRLVSPYAFAASNWLDPTPNPNFAAALKLQRAGMNGKFLYPPAYQWLLSKPILSPLKNLILWGLGLPLGIAAVGGFLWMTADAIKWRSYSIPKLMLTSYVTVVFFYVGTRFVHSIRYLLPIVPFLCTAAAYGFTSPGKSERLTVTMIRFMITVVAGLTGLYALAFVSIYTRPNTRVAVSRWIYQNVPPASFILLEHWDDPLPLRLRENFRSYPSEMMPVFDQDDSEKLNKLYNSLSKADYYILSSPRAWKTIGRLPNRFPVMTRFYQLLFDGNLGFVKAVEFTSYPGFGKIVLPDLSAEETFWVYDHAKVIVYKKTADLSWEKFQSLFRN